MDDDFIHPGCTGKRKFLTWDQANAAVKHTRTKTRRGRGLINVYRCRKCHHWHYGGSSFSLPKKR